MRKNRLLLLLASLLVLSIQFDAQAQQQKAKFRNPANDPVRTLPYYKKIRWADGLFKEGSYFSAIEYYSQLKLEQPRNPYLSYQLAECYMYSRDYSPAAKNYGEAYSLAAKLYPEAKFKEARMLKMQGLYDSSINAFNQFIADNPKTFKKLKKTAQVEINGAIMGKNTVNDPQPVTMKNAGPNVNSAYTEASPYPLGDTALLFSTMNQNSVASSNGRKAQYYSRFMTSHKQYYVADVDSFQWPLPFNDGPFNDDRIHTGNGCFSPGGDRFYFTRCKEGDTMAVICKIYVSTFDTLRGGWHEPTLIGEGINEEGSNTHPFVAKVGKKEILFFSSNRRIQSRGKYDLWYSVIDPARGTYRRPQNCGKQVNTEGNDMTPYYDSRTGTLYFASDGQVSMGGFDIYSAQGGPSRYSNLQNMGYPINTSADELYYIKDPVGKPDAYVVSNRVGSIALKNPTCCDDIWRIQTEPKLQVLGRVLNSRNQKLVGNVAVKMVDETGNLRTYNSVDGNFQFNTAREHNYVITGDKSGYSSTRAQVSTEGIPRQAADQTVNVTIYLDSLTIGDFRVSNVYYPFNSAELTAASVASLDSLVAFMKDNPSLYVNIYSHTDSIGSAKYNEALSLRRANAIRNYLVSNGVEGGRMTARARSYNDPARPNSRRNGADNAIGRQLNRRTEFEIVKEDPNRRVIFQSKFPGTIDAQEANLKVQPQGDDTEPADRESSYGEPGSRTSNDQNP